MKTIFLFFCTVFIIHFVNAQPAKRKPSSKAPSQADINKMMEEAMDKEGMSKEEKAEMKKMMQGVVPAMQEAAAATANYPTITSNKMLIPKKDAAKIALMKKPALASAQVQSFAGNLYNKLLAKADAAEMALAKKIIAQTPASSDLPEAAVTALLQGHNAVALAIALKAVMMDPANLNNQNNLAALLTQCGYPEQAMPLLKKLYNDAPLNSSIYNNMAYAWFAVGEKDSAALFSGMAGIVNPNHPDAKVCGGILKEDKNPTEATEDLITGLENGLDPFTEQLIKNSTGSNIPVEIPFETIMHSLPVYEFIPKNWMTIPEMEDNVAALNANRSKQRGFDKMYDQFTKKIKGREEELSKEVDDLMSKDEASAASTLMKEAMAGKSFMTASAIIVLRSLHSYQIKASIDFANKMSQLAQWKHTLMVQKENEIRAIYDKIDSKKRTSCEQFKGALDGLENGYMQQVNPVFRAAYEERAENLRQWVNAWATWNWFVAGNVRNTVLLQDIGAVSGLFEMYISQVRDMEVLDEHCSPKPDDHVTEFDAPAIPDFTCPIVVGMPSGKEWRKFANSVKNFDDNALGIKKTNKPVPNVSVAYGSGKMIAEPGFDPTIKTADGTINPIVPDIPALDELTPPAPKNYFPQKKTGSTANKLTDEQFNQSVESGLIAKLHQMNEKRKQQQDAMNKAIDERLHEQLVALNKKRQAGNKDLDELAPLVKLPLDELTPLTQIDELTPLDKDMLKRHRLIKELNEKATAKACEGVKQANTTAEKKAAFNKALMELSNQVSVQTDEEMNTQKIKQQLQQIQNTGLQPTINSGMQSPDMQYLPTNIFN